MTGPRRAPLGAGTVHRIGYGAMQLESLADTRRDAAHAVLRRAVELGVDHVDTAEFYGAGTVNELIREALHPYPGTLTLVSKVGAERTAAGELVAAQRPEQLREQVHANLRTLQTERLAVVNLRRTDRGPGVVATGDQLVDLDDQLAELVALRDAGLIGGIGLSAVTLDQIRQAGPVGIACVQNGYNVLARTHEDELVECGAAGIAWVPFFPLGSAFDHQRSVVDDPTVLAQAERLGATPAQVGLAWLLQHAPNVLLIPGTRSVAHLEQNLAAADLELDATATAALDALGAGA